MIRAARPDDISEIRSIEVAAGELFRGLGMEAIADDTPPTESELAPYVRDGRAWVATGPDGKPLAYILVDIVDGWAHIEQVTVHPDHSRTGLGRALIERVEQWSDGCGLDGMTLTTFRDVPWNARTTSGWALVTSLNPPGLKGCARSCVRKERTG